MLPILCSRASGLLADTRQRETLSTLSPSQRQVIDDDEPGAARRNFADHPFPISVFAIPCRCRSSGRQPLVGDQPRRSWPPALMSTATVSAA